MSYYLPSILKGRISLYLREIKNVANKGFFYLFTAQGLILVAGFASQFFVAGFLEPTGMGRIKIMQTYLNLSALVCGLGFDTSLLKLASENRNDTEKKKLYQTAFLMTVISFIFIYTFLCGLSFLNLISSDPVISKVFPVYLLFLLPLALQQVQLAYYQARKKIRMMARLQFTVKLISILFIIIFTYLFKLDGYVSTVVFTGFIGIVIFELGIKNIKIHASYFRFDFKFLKNMWHLAGYALIANIVAMVAATIDIYLINYLIADRKEVGFYMFALTILSVYQLFPITIQQVAFPFFSEQSSLHEKWYRSYLKYNRLNHLLVLCIFTAGLLLLPAIIKFVFSGKYDRSIYYFLFLSFAWMIKWSNMIKGTALMGYGRFDINFLSSLITLVLSVPIVFILIRYYGLEGAVAGMTIAAIISYVTVYFMFHSFNRKLSRTTGVTVASPVNENI